MEIEFELERPFDVCYNQIWLLRSFLRLGISSEVNATHWYGITERGNREDKGEECNVPVQILFKATAEPVDYVYSTEMLFAFPAISSRFGEFLRNWFEKADLLEPVYELYFGTLAMPGLYQFHEFLLFTQGLEAYHRRILGGKERADEEHVAQLLNIFYSVPRKYHRWLSRKLCHSNEISLFQRIQEIVRTYRPATAVVVKDENAFAQRVSEVRNYLTHYDERSKAKAPDWKEQFEIIEKLKILLQICLCAQIGFSSDELRRFAGRMTDRLMPIR